jgi:hypothetical protein
VNNGKFQCLPFPPLSSLTLQPRSVSCPAMSEGISEDACPSRLADWEGPYARVGTMARSSTTKGALARAGVGKEALAALPVVFGQTTPDDNIVLAGKAPR